MTPQRIIYLVNWSPALLKSWRELTEVQKREVIRLCETIEDENETEIEIAIEEVVYRRRRLF